MIFISLNADAAKSVEGDTIEESPKHMKKKLKNYYEAKA
jgi:hypothetical protein